MEINHYQRKKGFTVLEVIIAIFVITVGIVGIFSLFSYTISSTRISSQRLTAAYLAQEGIEIIRQIRDTNWLEQLKSSSNDWDEGLTACLGGCEIDYNDTAQEDPSLLAYTGQYLNIDGDGFYSYSAGTPTKFKRKITIFSPGIDSLEVTAEVFFETKLLITAKERLYNWR